MISPGNMSKHVEGSIFLQRGPIGMKVDLQANRSRGRAVNLFPPRVVLTAIPELGPSVVDGTHSIQESV